MWDVEQFRMLLNLCGVPQFRIDSAKIPHEPAEFRICYAEFRMCDAEICGTGDLDLQYSHTFIISISCLHLPTFRSQAAIVSEISTVFTFSHRKAKVTKFDLAVK